MTDVAHAHFADRLYDAVDRAGSAACVGLDPVLDRLPESLRSAHLDPVEAIEAFSRGVVGSLEGRIGVIKAQSACFERYGAPGVEALRNVIKRAHEHNCVVILDAKRGDIGVSAEHYAAFAFEAMNADALTINASLGADTVQPYLTRQYADRGVFILVRTSNPGSDDLQSQSLIDGRTVAEMMADVVIDVGKSHISASGFSSVGAVVAATKPDDAAALRARMKRNIFLVPGYGAQGGSADTVKNLFRDDGRGAIITASRSVIYAFKDAPGQDWRAAIRDAAGAFATEVANITNG